jgi:Anti-sigma-K factor rskA, C-terminal
VTEPDEDRVLRELGDALAPPERASDPARVAALRERVGAAAPPPPIPLESRRARARAGRPALVAAACLLVLLVAGGAFLAGRLSEGSGGPGGVVEYAGSIDGAAPGVTGTLRVTKQDIGRVVRLRTDDLPILPTGEFYEVWFLGPGDAPGSRRRISAGTFHPDPAGRSDVSLTAAVDPMLYPVVAITAQPGGGAPGALGPEVMRVRIS